jgi:hypothetical protein
MDIRGIPLSMARAVRARLYDGNLIELGYTRDTHER